MPSIITRLLETMASLRGPRQPALLRARDLGELAARSGFDWRDASSAFAKIHEEVRELEEALLARDMTHAEEELGDLLFAIAQVARHLDMNAELALRAGNEKFQDRFDKIVSAAGGGEKFKQLDLDAKHELWQKIKRS